MLEQTMETLDVKKTYADYAALPEGAPYQLIDGELIMSPSPTPYHQLILKRLIKAFDDYVEQHDLGEVIPSPIDVFLSETTTLQPDILFIARERLPIIGKQRVEAAPDLVVEILSPATAYYDLKGKKRLYEAHGVQEYWIVDPEGQEIEVFVLREGRFERIAQARDEGSVASQLLEGFSVALDSVF